TYSTTSGLSIPLSMPRRPPTTPRTQTCPALGAGSAGPTRATSSPRPIATTPCIQECSTTTTATGFPTTLLLERVPCSRTTTPAQIQQTTYPVASGASSTGVPTPPSR